jgi:superfamily I DNA/RNA helicase
MMPGSQHSPALPDADARQRALLDYGATLLVEAGAGSGKTALMAGRVVLMLAHGIRPRDIVAITFTEAAAAELLERIERFVASLKSGLVPPELQPFGWPARSHCNCRNSSGRDHLLRFTVSANSS